MPDPAARFARNTPGVEAAEPLHASSTHHIYAARLADSSDEVRIVTPAPDASPEVQAAVADRLDAWASLHPHPALSTVHASGTEPRPWLAVAVVGKPLPAVAPLSVEDARSVIADVAEVLRDSVKDGHAVPVEPADVRVVGVDQSADFSAGARLDWPVRPADRTSPHTPPELTAGEGAEVGRRGAVFRLGTLAYYAVTGQPPAEDGDESANREGRWPSPSFVNGDVPAAFDAVVERALDPDPTVRYDSPYEFKRALLFESQPTPEPDDDRSSAERADVADDGVEREADGHPHADDRDEIAGFSRRTALGALGLGVVGVAGGSWFAATRLFDSETGAFPMFRYDAANTGHAPDAAGPTDGVTEAWSADLGTEVRSSPVVADGTVLINDTEGVVYAFDATDGAERWHEPLGVPSFMSAAIGDDAAYLPDGTGRSDTAVTARDLADGSERWRVDEEDISVRTPVLADGVLFAFGNQALRAVDVDRASVLWTAEGVAVMSLTGAVSDDTLYVGAALRDDQAEDWGGQTRGVVALDVIDGGLRWASDLESFVSSSPAVVDDTVYVGTDDDSLVALDTGEGETRWRFETDGPVHSSPAVTDHGGGTVYVGCIDGRVYAVDTERHEQRWAFDTGAEIVSSPAVVSDTVYVGNEGGSVIALDAEEGEERWRFETDGPVISSPAVVSNTVFVGSDDGYVYALTEP